MAKLKYYRDQICDLNVYNTKAAEDQNMPYGNPWQLIYVFDKNPSTNVVCEGYSKAFKYLCDLTTFKDSSIKCYTVSGDAFGGAHMWNIVRIKNKSYLVDITNCDDDEQEEEEEEGYENEEGYEDEYEDEYEDDYYYDYSLGAAANYRDCMFLLGGSGSVSKGYSVKDRNSGEKTKYKYDSDTKSQYTTSDLTLNKSNYLL